MRVTNRNLMVIEDYVVVLIQALLNKNCQKKIFDPKFWHTFCYIAIWYTKIPLQAKKNQASCCSSYQATEGNISLS